MDKAFILSLASRVENEYLAFLNEIKKLEVVEYPTTACVDFLFKLRTEEENGLKKIERIREQVLDASSLPNSGKLEIDEIKAVRVRLIQSLAPYIDWINGAQTKKVPWSFIPTVEQLAKNIVPTIQPILYSESRYNYRIVWWEVPAKNVQGYCFISLPNLHRTNILMHSLIGHELFHPQCKQFTTSREKAVASDIAKKCKDFLKVDPQTLFGQKELAHLTGIIMLAWERALHELLCDMFCAELFGPASLLGMRAYAAFSDSMTQPGPDNNFYPPWQYRFEVVWQKAIDKGRLEKLLEKISKHQDIRNIGDSFRMEIGNFARQKALESTKGYDFVINLSDSLFPIAYRKVNDVLEDAHKYVMTCVAKMPSKWSDEGVLEQIPYLLRRLQNGIPPNEIPNFSYDKKKKKGNYSPQAAELPAILIAGWMYQVHRERNYAKRNMKLLPFETLCRLLLKACEDSEMIRFN